MMMKTAQTLGFGELAQSRQLHLEHKLCLPPAMAELGFGDQWEL